MAKAKRRSKRPPIDLQGSKTLNYVGRRKLPLVIDSFHTKGDKNALGVVLIKKSDGSVYLTRSEWRRLGKWMDEHHGKEVHWERLEREVQP